MATPLLLAYDPACIHCCRLALGLARRDQRGLLLILSVRDPDLLVLAPELAGKPMEKEIHGLDLGTRDIGIIRGLEVNALYPPVNSCCDCNRDDQHVARGDRRGSRGLPDVRYGISPQVRPRR